MEFYNKDVEKIALEFGTDLHHGLSADAVEVQRLRFGKNEIKKQDQTPWYILLLRQFTGILIYILVVAALVSGLLGEWVDAIAIVAILVLNGILGFIQEFNAQSSIESLKKLTRSKATVLRNGKRVVLDTEELVPGDMLILQTGDKVGADARLADAISLECQEGALTGESTPVAKDCDKLSGGELALGDQINMVFAGTAVTKGRGRAVVVATGMNSQIGKIAHLIQEDETEEPPLMRELDRMGSRIGKITLFICAAIFSLILLSQAQNIALQQLFSIQNLKDPFILSVSLAVAAIPEGLAIVVTIALAFGTRRMVRKHALIKRLASVETLGSTTVICSDKTGTLTRNEMTVVRLWHAGESVEVRGTGYSPEGEVKGELPEIFYHACVLCNDSELFLDEGQYRIAGDPTEGCLLTLAAKSGLNISKLREEHERVHEEPFSSEAKKMSTVNRFGDSYMMLSKGAPDIIIKHCSKIYDKGLVRDLSEEDRQSILDANESFAKDALRVLGFAYRDLNDPHKSNDEEMIFIGLAGMIDPPREEVKDAIRRCRSAGIAVVMITGDHKTTATAIAHELGIEGRAVEGSDLHKLDLIKEVENIAIYARVNPEHKLQIVEALRERGEIVAMTGDGVNDAPALKHADIGIAMGMTGTEVSKESAEMILTDDNFTSIVNAVEEGRNIYTNIKKFVNYLLSSNFAEVLVILIAILFLRHDGKVVWPLTAIMILFINLLTDSLPALALGVDPGDKKVMRQAPRNPDGRIISKNMVMNITLIGSLVALATLYTFHHSLEQGLVLAHAQSVALTTLIILEIVRLAMIRAQYHTPWFSNPWLFASLIIVLFLQMAVLYTPLGQLIFGTVALSAQDWMLIVIVAVITYFLGMLVGFLSRRLTGQWD